MEEQQNKTQTFGYLLGRLMAIVVCGCLCGCVIGLTARFIMWLFGL